MLAEKIRLSNTDRQCHIPTTRIFYLTQYPSGNCHDHQACLVCPAFSEKAAQEIALREQRGRKEAIQKRTRASRARIESAKQTNRRPSAAGA
ncbi:MAG: hypothetical protein KBC83_02295 [Candidatus Moranbacteria bacterium]|nr:hypothetical protein [Candidatus Moranbacteria bacterium]